MKDLLRLLKNPTHHNCSDYLSPNDRHKKCQKCRGQGGYARYRNTK